MNNMLYAIVASVCAAVIVFAITIGGWYVTRKINYSLSYRSMVEDTVREMVKHEALK